MAHPTQPGRDVPRWIAVADQQSGWLSARAAATGDLRLYFGVLSTVERDCHPALEANPERDDGQSSEGLNTGRDCKRPWLAQPSQKCQRCDGPEVESGHPLMTPARLLKALIKVQAMGLPDRLTGEPAPQQTGGRIPEEWKSREQQGQRDRPRSQP
jgi:hypothetical protein